MESELQQINAWKDELIVLVTKNGANWAIAVAIVALGFWLGKSIANLILNICKKRDIDITLARFFAGFAKTVIIIFAAVMALGKAGIEITPLVALLGASAFGLSLAVQGPISNYGAGVVLIITRPFKVGDTLTLNGLCGLVDCVNLGNTQLINEDEERITIPNRKVLGEIFTNSEVYKVVEAEVGIAYSSDPEQAIRVITEAVRSVEGISQSRDPDVGIDAFGDSSINIGYRVWVPTERYHRMRYALNLAVYKALQSASIEIPFPQRDVHLIDQRES
ncbi:MAG: mechanosensitive ion channel family protein [Coraliomargarita sp.]